jgi:hypothetical protein
MLLDGFTLSINLPNKIEPMNDATPRNDIVHPTYSFCKFSPTISGIFEEKKEFEYPL